MENLPIAIGPFPKECVEVLTSDSKIVNIMGNHDAYFVHGIPDPRPHYMDEEEAMHQEWTHSQLDETFHKKVVAQLHRRHIRFSP